MLNWILSFALLAFASDLETGKMLRREGRLDEAVQLFEQILASEPGRLEARLELGHTYVLAGRYREAIETYAALGDSADSHWKIESAKWMGLTYLYLGQIDKSLSENDRQIRLAREAGDRTADVEARWYRGHIYTELGRVAEANDAFLEALESAPNDLNTLHLAGVMAARQGDEGSLRYQIEDLQQVVRESGDPSQLRRVYHLQAELALLQEQPRVALDLARKANALKPHPLYRDTVARAQSRLDDAAEAEISYRSIVNATDERLDIPLYYIKALLGLATTLEAQAEHEEAVSYYEKLLALWADGADQLPGSTELGKRLTGPPQ